MAALITDRELNLATLARQFLLRRAEVSALDAIEHLAGLQAQAPNPPYLALWARLKNFAAEDLSTLSRSARWCGLLPCGARSLLFRPRMRAHSGPRFRRSWNAISTPTAHSVRRSPGWISTLWRGRDGTS